MKNKQIKEIGVEGFSNTWSNGLKYYQPIPVSNMHSLLLIGMYPVLHVHLWVVTLHVEKSVIQV